MEAGFKDYQISAMESFSDLERRMGELIVDEPFKVRFTSALDTKGALGVEAAFLQLVGTWIRKNKHRKIFHSYHNNCAEDFSKLCSSIYGVALLSLVDEVWDVSGERLKRGMVLDSARQYVEALRRRDFSKSFKSKYLGIPYIKTSGYDKEFDMPFYNNSEVVEAGAFFRIFEKILEEKIAGWTRFNNLKKSIDIEDLSDMLWELFKNTHDHGRCRKNGDEISSNFRTIVVQQQDIELQYFDKWLGDNPTEAQMAFADYWKAKKYEKYPFLDLSVVDFGEGFVDLAKKKTGLDNDKEVLLKCLESGWSRLMEKSRGDGLTKVIKAVRKHKGWLRIRTGRYLIEKTFDNENNNDFSLGDVKEMAVDAAGTSFHVSFYLKGFREEGAV